MSTRAQRHSRGCVAAWLLAMGAAGMLAGCAAVPSRLEPGVQRAEVLARAGTPTAVYALADGERLQYSELPAGVAVHNLDFDRAGRLVHAEQALTLATLYRIEVDRWSASDVRMLLGRPYRVERVARFDGEVWTYRFRDIGDVRLIHVHLDPQGVVRKIQFTDQDPGFDPLRR